MAGIPQSAEGFLLLISHVGHSKTPKALLEIQGVVFVKLFIHLGWYSQNCIHNQAIKSHFQQWPWCAGSPPNFQHCPLFWASFIVFLEMCLMRTPPTRKNGENKAWLSSHFQNVPCYICIFLSFSILFAMIKATFSKKGKSLLAYQQFFCLNADNLCSVKGNIQCFYLLEWLFMERSLEDAIKDNRR